MPASKEIRPTPTSTTQILRFPTPGTLAGIGNQPFMMVSQGVGRQTCQADLRPMPANLRRVGIEYLPEGHSPDPRSTSKTPELRLLSLQLLVETVLERESLPTTTMLLLGGVPLHPAAGFKLFKS